MLKNKNLAIIGAGNIGLAIAGGLIQSGLFTSGKVHLTRRKSELLKSAADQGFKTGNDNPSAVRSSDIIIIAVEPHQVDGVLTEIAASLKADRHILISVVTGISIAQMKKQVGEQVPVVRVMPNTAIAIRESMTCLAVTEQDNAAAGIAQSIFDTVGKTLIIEEEQMIPATALCACGIAFFLRAIRSASQGGIEIGFHSDAALLLAAQTAKGAASLLLKNKNHPEHEIDKVTTPRGVTISGLNQMEHEGFSSAMIKGITTSAEKASRLYRSKKGS